MIMPCKTKKCICYPVCISKEEIDCIELSDFFNESVELNEGIANKMAMTWSNIHFTFPKLRSIILGGTLHG